MQFTIVTDSACNLPDELIEKYNLEILSLSYNLDGKEYLSYVPGQPTDLKTFYALLRNKATVTTSLISPERALEQFTKVLEKGQDLLYIGFSSGLSGSFNVCRNVIEDLKEQYPDRKIYAVDTLAASLGQGLLVHYAVQLRDLGKSIEEVRDWLLENRLHLAHWFTVDDLFFLKRGGRISAATALVGSLIGIKPVMHVDDEGHLIAVAKARGRKASIEALCAHMEKTAINPAEQTIFISHGDCVEDAEHLASLVRERMVDSVIGAHSGPGTLALFFMATTRD